ncbi:sigma-54-dependent Fis family transcriptional regulator [Vibrio sp. JPW-9-11-11]|uniref:sigma-54-dependent Fis family transcriptional regulator n=1 Tax=Vibrio sp. JPW-9-11-11 TaxID=1416532 RepID=UPI001592D540|nr:sigma-54-dependent Fis family transcriptional regulator [Vibrio sp. JPW-9-11-11]NVD07788.1 sigma-54-dependent Fis family transcriptional regulator [Vibrio sp. JPW-9-11-11]
MQLQNRQANDWLTSSWHRSSEAGLKEIKRPNDAVLSNSVMKERRYNNRQVIEAVEQAALPLFNQVLSRTDSRLIVTDGEGVILASWGQERFREKLLEIALESGNCWQESLKGTNAIGTALYEQRAVSVIGEQHFIKQHRFISCSASPLFDHRGELVAILDVTSEQAQHDVTTQLLVQNMVQLVENRLLTHTPEAAVQIDLALSESVLNTGWQGIVIADHDGRVVAHNHVASELTRQTNMLGVDVDTLLKRSKHQTALVYKQHQLKRASVAKSCFSAASELHCGEDKVESAWQQANKVLGKDISLLILGETGVGKGEFVKALHQQSDRSSEPLVTVNCGALAKELIESELFGYAPGAFTGANSKGYVGRIRQADGGILFLDEIGEMPLDAQCRLLTVLQDKMVMPVGSSRSYQVDLQIIAATHQDLAKLVVEGRFREDLYYRLNGLIIELPALRERNDKRALIEQLYAKYKPAGQTLSPALLDTLCHYHWPGNLRELDNLFKVTCLIASEQSELTLSDIPSHLAKQILNHQALDQEPPAKDLQSTVNSTLLDTYRAHDGNISKVSRVLGVSRNTIYRKLKALGVC